ncbi:hypothetical protein ACFQY4_29895 [Catellatospora bangladeshensis]|uniref:Uncharacterized protein n=1 Tax=Catellatospora bangladeshensis TaxID=310355 RepID=A0A8J3NID7_9ACTN|nr:hypothetical protein [Catellatospora bangladeshensis]GIF80743.1 hypothetical protein Cba03nite_20920 [Catellatospora bangladeshensis]
MIEPSPVTRSSLRHVLPILVPAPMAVLPTRTWSDEQWERITLGYRARGMDERWDVFVEDQTVFLHRSWTGFGIYEASFSAVAGEGWRISAAVTEADPSRCGRTSDQYDRVMLELVLSTIVLGEPAGELRVELVALMTQTSGRTDTPAGLIEHSMVGLRSDR